MDDRNKYIRFDWAAKKILRDKANFAVLEGLLTVLIGQPIKIEEILESESNQADADNKFNRVDIKARNSKGEIIIVEIQLARQLNFLKRILFGVSKTITEQLSLGDPYEKIKKVYSISILYCNLGEGTDYVYHGQVSLRGIHTGDSFHITAEEAAFLGIDQPNDIFQEYFVIRVNNFNKVSALNKNALDEWVTYLKTGLIRDDTTTPGLAEAREKLKVMSMSATEREAYEKHFEDMAYQDDVLACYKQDGFDEGYGVGREEGREEGREATLRSTIATMKKNGLTKEQICLFLSLDYDEFDRLS